MRRLGEIALFTADVDRLVEFYRTVLEAEPAFWQRGEAASFTLGDVSLFLHRTGAPAPDLPPNHDHIAFFVDDVDAESARLRAQGVEAQTSPRDFYWGRSAYYRDPDGRQVELHRPPQPTPQRG
ncbi:MAG: VOC family protein [Gemmatimonadales bacterium]